MEFIKSHHELLMIITIIILLIDKIVHLTKWYHPLKKIESVKVGYKEAVLKSISVQETLKQRDIHIQGLEDHIKSLKKD